MTQGWHVRLADWPSLQKDAQFVRTAVFVIEQKIPADLEWDAMDAQCDHAVAYDEVGEPIATGRLLPDGHIGRMAVLAPWRGRGIGAAVLHALYETARERGDEKVELNAQISARDFYLREGFQVEGASFMEAGIEHVHMYKRC